MAKAEWSSRYSSRNGDVDLVEELGTVTEPPFLSVTCTRCMPQPAYDVIVWSSVAGQAYWRRIGYKKLSLIDGALGSAVENGKCGRRQ